MMKELLISNLENLSTEELLKIKAVIEQELQRRASEIETVVYQHDCFSCSSYHKNKYKHWAKKVQAVDTTKTTGYAFVGEFLPVDRQSKVPNGSIVVEVCGHNIKAYRVSKEGKETIAEATTNRMAEFIEKVAAALQ